MQEVGRIMNIRVVGTGSVWKRPKAGRVSLKVRYRKYVCFSSESTLV